MRGFENIFRELSVMRALLEDGEVVDLAESFPNFGKLGGEQFSKEWPDANVGKKIAASSDGRAIAGIVAVLGMIKCLFHEPGERLWAVLLDLCPNKLDKRSVQSENVQRPTPNVQFLKMQSLNLRFDVGR